MLRVLHVMNDFPFPPNHGGRLDVWGRLRALEELGCRVDALVTVKTLPDAAALREVSRRVRKLQLVRRAPNVTGILSRRPLQIETRRALSQLRFSDSYDVVLLEQEYTIPVLEAPSLEYGKACLRVHNCESAYYAELARTERNWWKKAYYRVESERFREASKAAFRKVDELWFISWNDYLHWVANHRGETRRAEWLPAAVAGPWRPWSPAERRVLIAGNLFQPTNLEGVEWYLNDVHPRLSARGGYELWIAGSTRGSTSRTLLARLYRAPRVRLFLNPPRLASIYEQCAVFVNPMQHGVSVKLKTLDAIAHGLPVVSTPAGIEGTGLQPGEHVLLVRDGAEMASVLQSLLESPARRQALAVAAQGFLKDRYDHTRNLSRLMGLQCKTACSAHGAVFETSERRCECKEIS